MALITELGGNSEILTGYGETKRNRRVNGEKEMSLLLHRTDQNAHYFDDISYLWTVSFDNDEYVIVGLTDITYGDSYYRELSLLHRFYHDLRNAYRYEQITGSRTLFDCLTFVLEGTGYTFNIVGSFIAQELENFGDSSVLELFKNTLDSYGAEFTVSGSIITIRAEIGSTTDFQYRHRFNIRNVKRELDALDFSTYGKGFGKNGLVVEYKSALYDIFGKLEYPAIRDDKFTVADNLLARVKSEVDASLKIAITFEFEDMRAAGYPGANPTEGDHVLLFDERMNISVDTRIVEIQETFNGNEEVIDCTVTLSNFTNLAEQQSQMENAVKKLSNVLSGKGTLPFNALDAAMQNATRALQSAQTEIMFENGLIAVDKTDEDNIVLFNSAGIGISTDGGQTFNTAMTAEGIVADVITTGMLNANDVRIWGGDDDTYTYMDGSTIEVHGFYDRVWIEKNETVDSLTTIGNGYVRMSKLNDTEGRKNLYFTHNGIATYLNGLNSDEGFGSGVIEFWSHLYDTDRRGLTLYSNLGSIGLKTQSRDIWLDSDRDVNILASTGTIKLRPRDDNRTGDNYFVFNVKDNASKAETDGFIQYGSPSGYASGIRFSKDPSDPAIYITNGDGDFFTGDIYARNFDTNGNGYFIGDVKGSIIAPVDNLYAMVDGEFRVTNKQGYNEGNPIYSPIRVSEVRNGSSIKYKTNVEELSESGLAVLNQLDVVKYDLKADIEAGIHDNKQIGLIAEESPNVATADKEAINLYKLVSYNVKATQELSEMVVELQRKITRIEEAK